MFVSSLSVYENHYLSASLDQPIKRVLDNSFSCELVSSLSAHESSLMIYLEQSCQSYMIPMHISPRAWDETVPFSIL